MVLKQLHFTWLVQQLLIKKLRATIIISSDTVSASKAINAIG